MMEFKGFSESDKGSIPIQGVFFTDILPEMENLDELRVVLFAFWHFAGQSKDPSYIRFSDFLSDERLAACFGDSTGEQESRLAGAFQLACEHNLLLYASQDGETYYFLNSDRGLAARDGLQAQQWHPGDEETPPIRLQPERPNIYTLYEQNIGPLTPILAETLRDAEEEFPAEWIEDAIRIAVIKNVRTWRYVEAILRSWKEKGRDGTDRKAVEEDRKRDSEGKYADYINH